MADPAVSGPLGVQQWGVSQSTLEEAFIRIVTTSH
jgi:hypothetical protein